MRASELLKNDRPCCMKLVNVLGVSMNLQTP